jgi:translocation and assembly module TamB
VRLPEESNRTLQSLDPHQEVTVMTEAKRPSRSSYPLELDISGGNVVRVQRNDFQASIEPSVKVRYADPALNVDGLITFYAGEFEVFGKRFQVNTGSLRFDGGPELNPEVYLMATQKTDSGNRSAVNVWVTGTMQKPEVTFNVDVCSGEAAAINYLLSGQCGSNADDSLTQDTGNAPAAFAAGVIGGFLTLGAQRELKGFAPRIAIERTENAQRVHAGFSSESLIPPALRGIVQRIYIAGGVLSPNSSTTSAEGTSTGPAQTALELLVDLYFPHNLVGSARVAPPAYAFDMLWEP